MSALLRGIETSCIPRRLTVVVVSLLLTMLSSLTGCGGGESGSGDAQVSPPPNTGITASLTWTPLPDPSVVYFVHYGRQSIGNEGSCAYEHYVQTTDSSVTITNLKPDTLYFLTVSAYDGNKGPCSPEVWTITPAAPV